MARRSTSLRWLGLLFGVIVVLASSRPAPAAFILVTSRAQIDALNVNNQRSFVDWSIFGPENIAGFPTGFPLGTSAGTAFGSISLSSGNASANIFRGDNGSGIANLFAPGAAAVFPLDTTLAAPASLIVDFSVPAKAAGAQVQTGFVGPFTGTLDALDANGVLLFSSPIAGTTAVAPPDDSAPFFGVLEDTGLNLISRLVFTVTGGGAPFLNVPQLNALEVVIPEPTSIALFGMSLAGLAGYGWIKRKRVV